MLRTFFARGRKAEEEEENLSLRLSVVLLLVAPPPLIKLQLYNLKRYTQGERDRERKLAKERCIMQLLLAFIRKAVTG